MSGIRVQGLTKSWRNGVRAVDDVSFDVPPGTLTVLLGPSGCGKSTILRLIAGLEDASAGAVFIGDKDVTPIDPARRGVSMVFQSYALFPHLDVGENILFGLKVRGVDRTSRQQRLANVARTTGLDALLDRKPAQLSGGQRQRVALARAIVSEQPVCLMDEPLSNLDAKLRAEMRDEIRSLQQKLGLTMVYVTHDQAEAMSMADQVVLLRAGRIEQTGSPPQLYERPGTTFAARFIGVPPMNVIPADTVDRQTREDGFLGVRPEAIELADREGLAMTVKAVDYMGAETIVRLGLGQHEVLARVSGRTGATTGDRVFARWPDSEEHYFDKDGFRRGNSAVAAPPAP